MVLISYKIIADYGHACDNIYYCRGNTKLTQH